MPGPFNYANGTCFIEGVSKYASLYVINSRHALSGALAFLNRNFSFSPFMEGWFVSSALLGYIIGVALSGRLSDAIGRKKVMIVSAGLFFVAVLGSMIVAKLFCLILFRIVGRLGIGVASMVFPLYISEIASPHIRGRMVVLYRLAIIIGIVTAYFSNAYLLRALQMQSFSGPRRYNITENTWRSMIRIGVIPSLLFRLGLLFIPESPRWLYLKGNEQLAFNTLSKINPASATSEMNAIKPSGEEESGSLRQLLSPQYRTALIIGLALPFLSQVSGINAVTYFGPSMLDKAGFSLGDALGGQVTIVLVNVVFTFVSIFTVDKWGRKPLLGLLLAVLSLLVISVLFYFNVMKDAWILVFILLVIASFAFSFRPGSFIIINEIFPNAVRAKAVLLGILSLWIANLFIRQLTPVMLRSESWEPPATFRTFAVLCAPSLVHYYCKAYS